MKITTTILKDNNMKNENIRATIKELIKEIKQENRQERVGTTPSESKQLSEVRMHIRNAINEMMVGLTPITRMNTQRDANNAKKGNNTNTGIDTADIGFNTFDMQEWASIAGITEEFQRPKEEMWGDEADLSTTWAKPDGIEGTPVGNAVLNKSLRSNFEITAAGWADLEKLARDAGVLKEHWEDDGYGSNVIDLRNPMSDESHEIPGMISSELPEPASWDTHRGPGPVTGDIGHEDEVDNMGYDFERFLVGLEAQDAAGTVRIGAAAVEGDEHYEDEYTEFDGEGEFSFTGDVGELPGDDAFAIGLEAGKRGLDDEEPHKPRG
jgi:hypothetical protein